MINFNDVVNAYGISDVGLKKIYGQNGYLLWEKNSDYDPTWEYYEEQPFTVKCIEDGYFRFTFDYNFGFEVSLNNSSWTDLSSINTYSARYTGNILLSAGDILKIRSKNTTYDYSPNTYINVGPFQVSSGSTGKVELFGNILSLYFNNYLEDNTSKYAVRFFNHMFDSTTNVIDVRNLVLPNTGITDYMMFDMFYQAEGLIYAPKQLPATVLSDYCYTNMFMDCTSLITSPVLPATTLVLRCYQSMFNGCTKLNNIKCLATDISADYCLNKWTNGVSLTGTFTKKNEVTWPSGVSGIPTGWTIIEE